ncbi:MAG: copper resistance CopC family protein, partial [Pseudonocardia sp.]
MTWLRGLRPARLAAQVARVVAVVALLLTISAVGSSPSVHARAHLVGANPPDGAMLTEPPQAVTLTFAEPVDAAQSIITVHDPISRPASIQPRPHISDTNTLEMPIVATEPGRYQTHYMVTAADGHAVTGILTFTLTATPSEAGAAEPPDETNPALGND